MNTSANFMENRNSIAKSKILAKLRTNQDFMMNTQVSSTPQVWTRWHQERVLNQEMDQPTNGMRNQRYIQVSHPPTLLTVSYACLRLSKRSV